MIVLYGLICTTTGQSSVLMVVEFLVHVFYDPLDKRFKDTQSYDCDPGLDLWNGSCGLIGGLYWSADTRLIPIKPLLRPVLVI